MDREAGWGAPSIAALYRVGVAHADAQRGFRAMHDDVDVVAGQSQRSRGVFSDSATVPPHGTAFVRLDDHAGRPVLLNFWGSECPPCIAELPLLFAQAPRHPGLQFLGIAVDQRAAATRFLARLQPTYPQLVASTQPEVLLRRPDVRYAALMTLPGAPENPETDPQVVEQLEIAAKYQGYIDRQQDEVTRQAGAEATPLPPDLDYTTVRGLSKEVQIRLNQHKPETIGQAGRIQGITPAAISLLLVWLKRSELARGREQKTA